MTSLNAATAYANSVVELQKKIFANKTMSEEQAKEYAEALQKGSAERIAELTEKFKGRVSEEDLSVIRQFAADRDSNKMMENLTPEGRKETVLQVAVIFEGSWQNNDGSTTYSNAAKFVNLYGEDESSVYVSGIGTDNIFDKLFCGAFGCGGDDKIAEVYNKLGNVYSDKGDGKILILDIQGFSRGGILARAFSNDFLQNGVSQIGLDSSMVDVRSLLLYDSVSSMTIPGSSLHLGYDISISPDIGKVVQVTAENEYRTFFPSQSLRYSDGSLPVNATEISLPGAHSDIGGAYGPDDQNKSNDIGNYVLQYMYQQAQSAGVPLQPLPENLKPSDETTAAMNNYLTLRTQYQQAPTGDGLIALQNSYNVLKHDERLISIIDTRGVYTQ
jgi:hypothetical protein